MTLLLGDCLEQMKTLADNSVDACVTDPPYGLSFMGKKWDYDVPKVDVWREVLRVLKPGAHLLSFGGTRTYHRMVVAIEDAGFEIRDQVMWIYGSGFPKSLNLKDEWQGWGTALKPANEPIVLARKPLEKGLTVAQNVQKWGTGAINVDAGRIESGERPHIERRNDKALDGDVYGSGINGSRSLGSFAQGRWPANVLFDEEAAAMLDEQSGTLKSGELKGYNIPGASANGHLQGKATRLVEKSTANSGGASRFFYVAKASKRERNAGLEGMPEKDSAWAGRGTYAQGRNPITGERTGKQPEPRANNHPTVKPLKLMEYLCRLITPPGGVILDPFMGSGSTGCAAKALGFGFIGCELSAEYMEIARRRIEHWSKDE